MANIEALPLPSEIDTQRRLTPAVRDIVLPAVWVVVGVFLSHVYARNLLALPPWLTAPAPLFLPQAVILSVLLLTPARRWWAYLAVYYVALVLFGVTIRSAPIGFCLLANIANVIEPLVGAALFRRFVSPSEQFTSLRAVVIYVGAVALGSVLGATWGSAARAQAGASLGGSWPGWFLADVLASLVLAPTIVLWVSGGRQALRVRRPGRLLEATLLGGAILLFAGIMLTGALADTERAPALLFLPVSLLVWAAVRFGPLGLMSALSLLMVLAMVGAAQQVGPFAGRPADANIFTLQLFLLGIGVPLFALAALAEEREQDRERLRQGRESYRAVVAKLPQSTVLRFGPDLRQHSAVGEGLSHLGLSDDGIEGKTPAESFPSEIAATLEPHYRAALAGKNASLALTHDGRTYQTEVLPIAAADPPSGMVFLQDVTEQRHAEELAATNAALEKLNQVKSAFVSVVSHEFRTPLTGIQAFSELLRDEEFPPERVKEYAGDINREAERLSRMIGDLLDLERMESGRMTLNVRPLDLNALVEEAISTAGIQTPQHTLRLDLDPMLPPLRADRDKLTQVLVNLLSNATKYSPDGGEVTVGTRHDGEMAHLWVQDQGMGIARDELEAIFERYTRFDSGHTAPIQGTGLGLPIVRQIAEQHGGRVWAESELGVGSTFHVTLPLNR